MTQTAKTAARYAADVATAIKVEDILSEMGARYAEVAELLADAEDTSNTDEDSASLLELAAAAKTEADALKARAIVALRRTADLLEA